MTYVNMTMTASIKNLGNKTVNKYGITLAFSNPSGSKTTDVDLSGTQTIKPKSSVTSTSDLTFNLYDADQKKEYESLAAKGGMFTVRYSYIHFTDGTEFRLHKKFE
jgi:preprotein translocase subunit SecD